MKHKIYKQVVLVILDGFGIAPAGHGNAISRAQTPTLDFLVQNFPSMPLQSSGPLVGLPWGECGNSEVGHLNIGAGRIVGQDLPRITASIQSGDFFKNKVFVGAMDHAKKHKSSLHLMGLVSPGAVHSLDEHLYALLAMAESYGLNKVFVHMFADGRDTEPKIARESLRRLNEKMGSIGLGKVATITGRFYAMDRGGHWNQTLMTYKAMVHGQGKTAASAEQAIEQSYKAQIFDEMIEPTVVYSEAGTPTAKISDNDAVIFFNFRSDRALQMTQMFLNSPVVPEQFRQPQLQNLYFAGMTSYAPGLLKQVAFESVDLKNSLAEYISLKGMTQFHIAESEKYAHVTAFFNCGHAEKFLGEERVIVTSPQNNSQNYSDHPQMSAEKLTDELTKKILGTEINLFVANFANTDVVGHTGSLTAAIEAVEFVDECLKKIMDACLSKDAILIVTADHGNCEQMINLKTGDIDKDHTTSPVPFLLAGKEFKFVKAFDRDFDFLSSRVPDGVISDIAPTILELFGQPKPAEMTGESLLQDILDVPVKKQEVGVRK